MRASCDSGRTSTAQHDLILGTNGSRLVELGPSPHVAGLLRRWIIEDSSLCLLSILCLGSSPHFDITTKLRVSIADRCRAVN
jgi:hypothetical protein